MLKNVGDLGRLIVSQALKWFHSKMIDLDTFTKMPKNVEDFGKLIVPTGFEKLPKVQKIAQSGHTVYEWHLATSSSSSSSLLCVWSYFYLAGFIQSPPDGFNNQIKGSGWAHTCEGETHNLSGCGGPK